MLHLVMWGLGFFGTGELVCSSLTRLWTGTYWGVCGALAKRGNGYAKEPESGVAEDDIALRGGLPKRDLDDIDKWSE